MSSTTPTPNTSRYSTIIIKTPHTTTSSRPSTPTDTPGGRQIPDVLVTDWDIIHGTSTSVANVQWEGTVCPLQSSQSLYIPFLARARHRQQCRYLPHGQSGASTTTTTRTLVGVFDRRCHEAGQMTTCSVACLCRARAIAREASVVEEPEEVEEDMATGESLSCPQLTTNESHVRARVFQMASMRKEVKQAEAEREARSVESSEKGRDRVQTSSADSESEIELNRERQRPKAIQQVTDPEVAREVVAEAKDDIECLSQHYMERAIFRNAEAMKRGAVNRKRPRPVANTVIKRTYSGCLSTPSGALSNVDWNAADSDSESSESDDDFSSGSGEDSMNVPSVYRALAEDENQNKVRGEVRSGSPIRVTVHRSNSQGARSVRATVMTQPDGKKSKETRTWRQWSRNLFCGDKEKTKKLQKRRRD